MSSGPMRGGDSVDVRGVVVSVIPNSVMVSFPLGDTTVDAVVDQSAVVKVYPGPVKQGDVVRWVRGARQGTVICVVGAYAWVQTSDRPEPITEFVDSLEHVR